MATDYSNLPPVLEKLLKYKKLVFLGIVVVIIGMESPYKVNTEEVGVVTRFGAHTKNVQPGLHFKIPFIDDVYLVPVERQQKEEFGFRTVKAGKKTQYAEAPAVESRLLTGDLNLATVEWVVQHRIVDPKRYLFEVRNPDSTLRDISEASMRQIVGNRTVNEVLTTGRAEIAAEMKKMVQELVKEYELGLQVQQVVLQDVNPPDAVKDAFNEVNEAQQQRETLINQAKSAYNKVIPKAKGQAKETIEKARGYATKRVNNAQGDVAHFNALYKEYIQAPEVTKQRLYLETMTEVLPQLGQKIITAKGGNNVLPLLQMKMKEQMKKGQ